METSRSVDLLSASTNRHSGFFEALRHSIRRKGTKAPTKSADEKRQQDILSPTTSLPTSNASTSSGHKRAASARPHRPINFTRSSPWDFPEEFRDSCCLSQTTEEGEPRRASSTKTTKATTSITFRLNDGESTEFEEIPEMQSEAERNIHTQQTDTAKMRRIKSDSEGVAFRNPSSYDTVICEELPAADDSDFSNEPETYGRPSSQLGQTGYQEESSRLYSVCVIGLEGVGKTSLINAFTTTDFCQLSINDSREISDDLEAVSITVSVDDEESVLAFVEADYTNSDRAWRQIAFDAYIVMYCVDSRQSFKIASDILYTLKQRRIAARRPTLLVANKIDLVRKMVVTREEAQLLAEEHCHGFVETSVTINHMINEVLLALVTKIKLVSIGGAEALDRLTDNNNKSSLKMRSASFKKRIAGKAAHQFDRNGPLGTSFWRRRNSKSCDNLLACM